MMPQMKRAASTTAFAASAPASKAPVLTIDSFFVAADKRPREDDKPKSPADSKAPGEPKAKVEKNPAAAAANAASALKPAAAPKARVAEKRASPDASGAADVEALRQQLAVERRASSERAWEVDQARREKEQALQLLEAAEKALADYRAKVDAFVIDRLRCEDARELSEPRAKHKAQIHSLGELVRSAPGSKEPRTWKDSETQRGIDARLGNNELQKKQIGQKPRAKKGKEEEFDDRVVEEMRKARVKRLNEEAAALEAEKNALAVARNAWLHEAKLLAMQPVATSEVLKGRYVKRLILGSGGFAEVWKAFDLREVRDVAIKIVRIKDHASQAVQGELLMRAQRECEIQKKFSEHAHIVQLYDYFYLDEDSHSFATVLEYCPGEDLDRFIKKHQGGVDEKDAKPYLLQILSGLLHLNVGTNETVIHYDLKPANILLDATGAVKIADFGLSKVFKTSQVDASGIELTSVGAGTNWYLPPEVLSHNAGQKISSKVDVWSCGVLYFELLYGKRPYGDGVAQDVFRLQQLWDKPLTFDETRKVSEEAKNFIRRCLTHNVEARPTVLDLCSDVYVVGPPKKPRSAPVPKFESQ